MKINFVRTREEAKLPRYTNPGDAAMDIYACNEIKEENKYVEYFTGLKVHIPEGHVGLLFPRSSISKTGWSLANSVGVIDSGFRGEVRLRFVKNGNSNQRFNKLPYQSGDRIAQLMIVPIPRITPHEVDSLPDSERGEGGFGSTGQSDDIHVTDYLNK